MQTEVTWQVWHIVNGLVAALPWLLGGFGAIALISWGPLGRSLRRLARDREEETAMLARTAAGVEDMRALLEEMAERVDFLERSVAARPGELRAPAGSKPERPALPGSATPH